MIVAGNFAKRHSIHTNAGRMVAASSVVASREQKVSERTLTLRYCSTVIPRTVFGYWIYSYQFCSLL